MLLVEVDSTFHSDNKHEAKHGYVHFAIHTSGLECSGSTGWPGQHGQRTGLPED